MEEEFEKMTLEELQAFLIDLEESLQNAMSLILLTKAMIRDIETEKQNQLREYENIGSGGHTNLLSREA